MDFKNISIPEVYKDSADFRFFCKWFEESLSKVKYDTENFMDLYDPLRCPEDLLWALADTMGFKYDDRLPASFNRLVLLYFMSMIYNRGSKDGVTLAAETNLAQFKILMQAQGYTDENGDVVAGRDILYNRLEDTSIPVNAASVTPHTELGYIDVVYYSTDIPLDACIEYVRPLGMFLFQYAGVRFDTRTKISVDARLTNSADIGMSFGPTQVGHYRRADYASLQHTEDVDGTVINDTTHTRNPAWYRNSDYEDVTFGDGSYGSGTSATINPGYRSLYSLQLSNNEEVVKALIDPIFSLGYGPQTLSDVYTAPNVNPYEYDVSEPPNYLRPPYQDKPIWNLRYDRILDEAVTASVGADKYDVTTVDADRTIDILNPRPAVNPIMASLGDAISMNDENTSYTQVGTDGDITQT